MPGIVKDQNEAGWFHSSPSVKDGQYCNAKWMDLVERPVCWLFDTPYVRVIPICLAIAIGLAVLVPFLACVIAFTLIYGAPDHA